MRRVGNPTGIARVAVFAAALAVAGAWTGARAEGALDCLSEQGHRDNDRRISGCTELIEQGGLAGEDLSVALATRALAYSLKGLYGQAVTDYDHAISLNPDFAVALNNRAWAYFRWGRAPRGLPDVERSLALNPTSPHSFDTRAHIRQSIRQPDAALADYWQAIRYGGEQMIRLYQCGLAEHGLYKGKVDGQVRPELSEALEQCVRKSDCDPLPADEQCRAATS